MTGRSRKTVVCPHCGHPEDITRGSSMSHTHKVDGKWLVFVFVEPGQDAPPPPLDAAARAQWTINRRAREAS